jgi:hypothetical protein
LLVLGLVLAVTLDLLGGRSDPRQEREVTAAASARIMCMPDPSACGFPDPGTTGVTPGVQLTPESGAVTLSTPGQVYENRVLTGSITVTAPNVTIRNVKLIATDDSYGIRAFSWQHNVAGLTLDHVEIDLNGHYNIKGIAFDGYTARNVLFRNGSDCAHTGSNVVIEDSYCALGPDADGDGIPDGNGFCSGPEHFDGFQSDGGRNITLRHNTIRNPCAQTSAILMSTNTEPIDRVTIDHNLVSGGGYTVYCGTDEGDVATNSSYTRNVLSREYFRTGGRWGPTTHCDEVVTANGNVWDGEYVPPSGGGGTPTSPPPTPTPTPESGAGAALSLSGARRAARRALARKLGRRYTRRSKGSTARCTRRADSVRCSVRWVKRREGRTLNRYKATVIVTRSSPTRLRCGVKVRHWARQCRCTRTIPSPRAKRDELVAGC